MIAAPGCYPTSIIVPLAPLLKANVATREHIVVNSFSGVSGAGKKAEEMYLFVERAESAKAYGLVKHRHLAEVEEQLDRGDDARLQALQRGAIEPGAATAERGAHYRGLQVRGGEARGPQARVAFSVRSRLINSPARYG